MVSGVYRFYETTGVPLDVVFEVLRDRNMIPCWSLFLLEAVEAGMGAERALSKLVAAISDSYGAELANYVDKRIREMAGDRL